MAAGCGPAADAWFPLRPGVELSYRLERGAEQVVDVWKVSVGTSVAGRPGYLVESPAGPSRLGWRGGVLYASMLAGTQYEPPLPVALEGVRSWRGTVTAGGASFACEATVEGKRSTARDPERSVPVLHVRTELRWAGKERTVESSYGQGVGLVFQSQRTGGKLDYTLRLLGRR